MSLKSELFKELNAHIRDCDHKSISVSAIYATVSIFFFTNEKAFWFSKEYSFMNIDKHLIEIISLFAFIAVGYIVFGIQMFYRSWKVHYMNLCYEMYQQKKEYPFGGIAPIWMTRTPSNILSFDCIIRSLPFFVNCFCYMVIIMEFFDLYKDMDNLIKWAIFFAYSAAIIFAHSKITRNIYKYSIKIEERRA